MSLLFTASVYRIDWVSILTKDKKIGSLGEEFMEDSDRTVIQGVRKLTDSLDSRKATMLVISGASVGKMFPVGEKDSMVIGRSIDCDICLPEEGISRNHARIDSDGHGNSIIIDLGSTNGTYFDGVPINRHLLRDGDKIQIGSTTILKYSLHDSIEEEFHQKQYEKAIRDGLTGAYNKRHFINKVKEEFAYSVRHNVSMSLILIDLDLFKKVNDVFGHQAGDMVLKKLVESVSGSLREEDVFARYGGEEFAVILRNQNDQRAYVAAERIRRSVETRKFIWQNKRIPVTISLGIATLSRANFRSPEDMLQEADQYLYRAKHLGRNRTCSVLR